MRELERAWDAGGGRSDIELLLDPSEGGGDGWTAPRWITAGDVLFFYHTKKAKLRIERLLKQAARSGNDEWANVRDLDEARAFLNDQLAIAARYAGAVFGCALVTGASFFEEGDPHRFWRSNIYAPTGPVHVFPRPIPDTMFREHVSISPGGSNTPLDGQAFAGLKTLAAAHNELPDFLANAQPGGIGFRDVTSDNWIEVSCSPAACFIREAQLRTYMLDYLLEELKDLRTRVHQECRCERGGRCTGVADYFVSIGGVWLSVEAKLNVRAERDLPGQVAKYVAAREFVPTRGRSARKTVRGEVASICLVADVAGLYLVDENGYVGCSSDKPLWERTQLNASLIRSIREHLSSVVR